jgi:translation elongation factor EF-1alpha
MKKALTLVAVVFGVFSIVTSCLILTKSTQTKEKSDISKESFKITIQDVYKIKDFGIYLTGKVEDGDIGIVLYGKVEDGKIYEGSKVIFIDENGKVLHKDTVFKIEVLSSANSSYSRTRQSFAEYGNDVAL